MKKIFLIIPVLLFPINSCAIFQINSDKTENLLPSETESPGWLMDTSPKNYTAKNLQKYNNNAEETLLLNLYGLKELSTVRYKNISIPSNQITVEIYKMSSAVNAFGILSVTKNEDYEEIKICEDSYVNDALTLARKENYYIRIKSTGYPGSVKDRESFCRQICDKIIKAGNALPAYSTLFGKANERSRLRYVIEGYQNLPELKKIFIRKIEISGKINTIFFTKRGTSHAALGELSNLLKNKERQCIMSEAGDLQTAFFKINDQEFIFVSVFKEWIIGILDAETIAEGERTINILHNDLKDFIQSTR